MGKRRAKTMPELRAEIRRLRAVRVGEQLTAVVNNAIRYGFLFGVARYMFLSIETLAGELTVAHLGVYLLTDVKLSEWAAYLLALLSCGYGWRERKLRRDTIERLAPRLAALESGIDPGRSSSSLTPRGDTRPEDRL